MIFGMPSHLSVWSQQPQGSFYANDQIILKCLKGNFAEDAAYGKLITLRFVISLINGCDSLKSSFSNRFVRGVFRLRPAVPKYHATWDVGILLKKLGE